MSWNATVDEGVTSIGEAIKALLPVDYNSPYISIEFLIFKFPKLNPSVADIVARFINFIIAYEICQERKINIDIIDKNKLKHEDRVVMEISMKKEENRIRNYTFNRLIELKCNYIIINEIENNNIKNNSDAIKMFLDYCSEIKNKSEIGVSV